MTMQRMLERDDFTKRREAGTPIYLHECLYPLMQGHDSVEIKADIELGGSEQLFSLMVARDLQKDAGQEPQICVTLPILRGLDGTRRMGKSLGNYIGIGESANQQFGKTMSIPDELMKEWFELLTDRSVAEIASLCDSNQTRPMDAKKTLGRDIVAFYYGTEAAKVAQEEWEKQFSRKEDPTEIAESAIQTTELQEGKISIVKLVALCGLAKSNSEARQKVSEGAVNIGPDRKKITDIKELIAVENGLIVRLGSRGIRRVKLV
jgi:tyrosyl-tRNA synthetase